MFEYDLEVRQSKKIVIIGCVSVAVFFLFFLGISIFALVNLLNYNNGTYDEFTGNIFGFCFSIIWLIIFALIQIYLLIVYKKQMDIYKADKLVRHRNGKIIFEVPYANIISIREGYESLFLTLKTPIVKCNGKKGPRNFYEHYSRADIHRIKQIITDKYFNIPIN